MKRWDKNSTGFTIVELLIVVVVIAILAAITIVAYNGITDRANTSAVQSQLSQAMKKVQTNAILNSEQYPATLADAGVSDGNGVTYLYTSDNTTNPKKFCITATFKITRSYYVSNTNSAQQPGICPGHNLVAWYENDPASQPPIITTTGSATVDTSVQRNGISSMRVSPGTNSVDLRNSPVTVTTGQVILTTLWLKTDSNWNGGGNSKIRYGNVGNGGALLATCAYTGVKLAWTQVSCAYNVTAGVTQVAVTVGNDASVGQIWIDDLSLTITGP